MEGRVKTGRLFSEDQFFIFVVAANPHSNELVSIFIGQIPIGKIHPCGTTPSSFLEMQ
jgi:hypothetical protein